MFAREEDEAEAGLLAIKERREHTVKGSQTTKSDKKTLEAGTLINKGPAALASAGDDQYPKVLQVPLLPHPTLSPFQRQLLLTSVASSMVLSTLQHNFTCARAHAGRVSAFCAKETLAILSTPSAQMWFFQ
jgi:hypothetical protein